VQCTLVLVLAGVAILAADWLFYPWAFYLGGHAHAIPYWYGGATLGGPGGDYVLYVSMSPSRPSRGTIGRRLPNVDGDGYLCTPRGERFPMHVYGVFQESLGRDSSNAAMRMEVYRRPWYFSLAGDWDRRPRLTLRGRWQGPDLVMDDGGTLSAGFLPDGRLYDGPARNQPKPGAPVPVVFHEMPFMLATPACPAAK
jgi:hypothetical protein